MIYTLCSFNTQSLTIDYIPFSQLLYKKILESTSIGTHLSLVENKAYIHYHSSLELRFWVYIKFERAAAETVVR